MLLYTSHSFYNPLRSTFWIIASYNQLSGFLSLSKHLGSGLTRGKKSANAPYHRPSRNLANILILLARQELNPLPPNGFHMFHCPIASLIPSESTTLSNLYIDAKHITSAPALICFLLIQLNLFQYNPHNINIIVIIINIFCCACRKKYYIHQKTFWKARTKQCHCPQLTLTNVSLGFEHCCYQCKYCKNGSCVGGVGVIPTLPQHISKGHYSSSF